MSAITWRVMQSAQTLNGNQCELIAARRELNDVYERVLPVSA